MLVVLSEVRLQQMPYGFFIDQPQGIPLITQSDPGSENYGIANCQTVTRQRLDPSLQGSLQHRWMNKKAMNVISQRQCGLNSDVNLLQVLRTS